MSQNSHFSDQELDTLFKDTAAQVTAPAFDDAYWAEVEAMLPAKKRKGIVFWFTVGGIPIVLGIIGLSLFGWTRNEKTIAQKTVPNQTSQHDFSQVDTEPHESDASVSILPDENQTDDAKNKTAHLNPNKRNENGEQTAPSLKSNVDSKTEVPQNEMKPSPNLDERQVPSVTDRTDPVLGQKELIFTMPVTLNDVGMNQKTNRSLPIYLDFALGYGQSYRQIDFENNWMAQFKIGAGVYSEIGSMQLSAGIDLRAEVPGNLSRVTYNPGNNQANGIEASDVTNFRGIYSVEFPLYAGGSWGRSSLGGMMVPGIQLGFSGTNSHYENTMLVSRDRVSGTIPDSKSLTMEFGMRYGYSLTEHVQFAASMNVDVLRPFQSDSYSGEVRKLPISFFLGLRRTF